MPLGILPAKKRTADCYLPKRLNVHGKKVSSFVALHSADYGCISKLIKEDDDIHLTDPMVWSRSLSEAHRKELNAVTLVKLPIRHYCENVGYYNHWTCLRKSSNHQFKDNGKSRIKEWYGQNKKLSRNLNPKMSENTVPYLASPLDVIAILVFQKGQN